MTRPGVEPALHELMTALWAAQGEERARLLAEAQRLAAHNDDAKGHLAYYHHKHEQPGEAERWLRALLRRRPRDGEAARLLVEVVASQRRLTQARRLCARFLSRRLEADEDTLALERTARGLGLARLPYWSRIWRYALRHPGAAARALSPSALARARREARALRTMELRDELSAWDRLCYLRNFAAGGYRWPVRDCDLCGAAASSAITIYHNHLHRIVACPACGLERVLRIPDGGYDVAEGVYAQPANQHDYLRAWDDKRHRQQRWEVLTSLLGPLDATPGFALEIGAGRGDTLSLLAQAGWRTAGIEAGSGYARLARERYKLDVRVGTVADLRHEPAETYDLILAFHVIEHLDKPSLLFEAAARLLKPGGKLLVETPASPLRTLSAEARRHPTHGYTSPSHMIYFTADTLIRYYERFGFAALRKREHPLEAGLCDLACCAARPAGRTTTTEDDRPPSPRE